jgi:hypothetical protein
MQALVCSCAQLCVAMHDLCLPLTNQHRRFGNGRYFEAEQQLLGVDHTGNQLHAQLYHPLQRASP